MEENKSTNTSEEKQAVASYKEQPAPKITSNIRIPASLLGGPINELRASVEGRGVIGDAKFGTSSSSSSSQVAGFGGGPSAAHHPFGPIFARGNQIPQQQGQGSGEPSNDDPQQQEERRQPKYWQTERQTHLDNYSWTKYGKKSSGKHKTRDYYRCSVKRCQAKKRVEKISDDEEPPRYSITYRGRHTCIDLSTPPVLPGLGRSSPAANSGYKKSIAVNRKEQSSNNSDDDNNTQAPSTPPGYFSLGDNPGLDSQGSPSLVSTLTNLEADPLIPGDTVVLFEEMAELWVDQDFASAEQQYRPNVLNEDMLLSVSIVEKMEDCCSILFLLPEEYEFERDTLIQIWMAGGYTKDELMGHECFRFLLNQECLSSSGINFVTKKDKFQINMKKIKELLHGQRDNGNSYLKWENECQKNINSTHIQHVSLVCNDINASTFRTLQEFSELRTLLFLRNYGNKVPQIPDNLFQSFTELRTLDLSRTHIKKLPSSVGYMIHLHYVDLSWTLIEWLPDIICSLEELQTLKLMGCSKLRGLPRQLKKLTKLRHLDVDVLRQLATVPKGIGALVNLQTLSAFLVGTEEGCKIQELKELNSLTGDFCIAMLENVGSTEEAKEAALNKKQHINKLELRWSASQLSRKDNNCYDVLDSLQPFSSLEQLQIFCYEGSTFPDWVSDPAFYQLTSITFFNCEHVSELPLIEKLPFLKHLELVKMNGVKKIERRGKPEQVVFSSLEKLEVNEMQSLRSWNWAPASEGDFKSLVELTINDCPELHEFHVLPCLSSIKCLEVWGCPKLKSLSETKRPDSLEELIVMP